MRVKRGWGNESGRWCQNDGGTRRVTVPAASVRGQETKSNILLYLRRVRGVRCAPASRVGTSERDLHLCVRRLPGFERRTSNVWIPQTRARIASRSHQQHVKVDSGTASLRPMLSACVGGPGEADVCDRDADKRRGHTATGTRPATQCELTMFPRYMRTRSRVLDVRQHQLLRAPYRWRRGTREST
ncbi:hypothetical protein OF83DRAFT_1086851 [Amylostereum chailletii]|nr:hypothetical protein OF83DRAFT_1086851 [Amylostereum chailletii]